MPTPEERAEINRKNAQNSTGPKTKEGKEKSRRNAMTHGMTAEHLTLENDDPEAVQAEAEGWFASVKPENHHEEQLVSFAAAASLRLQRGLRQEASVISNQRASARDKHEREQELKLIEMKRLFHNDPTIAVLELKSFGKGVDWLLDQWKPLIHLFETKTYWHKLDIIKDAARLLGYRPEWLGYEDIAAFEFVLAAICLIPDYQENESLRDYATSQISARYEASNPTRVSFKREEAAERVRSVVEGQIAMLEGLKRKFDERKRRDVDTLQTENLVPLDTPQNRLMLRYVKEAESSLIRTVKTIAKVQSDRKKEVENESRKAAEVESRNEATVKATSNTSKIRVGSYITIKGQFYEVADTGDGAILMVPYPPETPTTRWDQVMPAQEAVPMPISGV